MKVTEDSRSDLGLSGHDRRKLRAAVRAVADARHLRRAQAVLLFCQRHPNVRHGLQSLRLIF